MLENRVMRKILGPERDGVTGEWRGLHVEELYDLYCSPNFRVIKSRRMSWAEHVALKVGRRVTAGVLVGKPEGKRPVRRPRCRWEENIKIYFQELGRGGIGIDLAKNRDRSWAPVNLIMNWRIPYVEGNILTN